MSAAVRVSSLVRSRNLPSKKASRAAARRLMRSLPEGGAHGVWADDEPVPDRAVIDADLLDPCVPITSSTSCDQAIFVDQATDASLFSDAVLVQIDRFGQWLQR